MTIEQIIKSSLDEWTEGVPVPSGLSSSALHRARRTRSVRRLTAVSAAVLVAAAVAVTVPTLSGDDHARPAPAAAPKTTAPVETLPTSVATSGPTSAPPASAASTQSPTTSVAPAKPPTSRWTPLPLTHAHSGNTTVSAHVNESPPVHLIAADDLAVSAYYFDTTSGDNNDSLTWYMYNSTSGTYQHTSWSWVDVEPGLGLAAVLAAGEPQNRIGIVDIATGSVIRWIPTTRPVGLVRFSPDGTELLATTYDPAPDLFSAAVTGFIIVDLKTGYQTVVSSAIGPQYSVGDGAIWTYDGSYIYIRNGSLPAGVWFFTSDGHPTARPAHSALLVTDGGNATVSPNGHLAEYEPDDPSGGPMTGVENVATGKAVATQPVEDLLGWANNNALIAWGCGPGCPNEFHQQLVLVSLDGKHITQLSGFTQGTSDMSPEQWDVELTRR